MSTPPPKNYQFCVQVKREITIKQMTPVIVIAPDPVSAMLAADNVIGQFTPEALESIPWIELGRDKSKPKADESNMDAANEFLPDNSTYSISSAVERMQHAIRRCPYRYSNIHKDLFDLLEQSLSALVSAKSTPK